MKTQDGNELGKEAVKIAEELCKTACGLKVIDLRIFIVYKGNIGSNGFGREGVEILYRKIF